MSQFQSGQDNELEEARMFAGKRGGANPVLGQVTPSTDFNDQAGDDDGSTNDGPDRNMAFRTTAVPIVGSVSETYSGADEDSSFDGKGMWSRNEAFPTKGATSTNTNKFVAGSKGSGGPAPR